MGDFGPEIGQLGGGHEEVEVAAGFGGLADVARRGCDQFGAGEELGGGGDFVMLGGDQVKRGFDRFQVDLLAEGQKFAAGELVVFI